MLRHPPRPHRYIINMKHVPYSKSDVNTNQTHVPTVTNSPVYSSLNVNSTTQLVSPPVHNIPTVNNISNQPPVLSAPTSSVNTPTTPSYLYDLLTPHLLHQHSLRTTVHDLLLPLPPETPTPIPILATLHRLFSDSPRLRSLLPSLPPPLHHHVHPLVHAPYVSRPSPMLTPLNPIPYPHHAPCHFPLVTPRV